MVVSEIGNLGSTSEADIGNVRLGSSGVGFERSVVADETAGGRGGARMALLSIYDVRAPERFVLEVDDGAGREEVAVRFIRVAVCPDEEMLLIRDVAGTRLMEEELESAGDVPG